MHKDTTRKFPRLVIYYINFTKMFLQRVETLISFSIPVADCKKKKTKFFFCTSNKTGWFADRN